MTDVAVILLAIYAMFSVGFAIGALVVGLHEGDLDWRCLVISAGTGILWPIFVGFVIAKKLLNLHW